MPERTGILTCAGHICMICGFLPMTKNKYRELQDHLVRKHFNERIKAVLPTRRPYKCPEPSCDIEGKDWQALMRHYTGKHGVLEAFLREVIDQGLKLPENPKHAKRRQKRQQKRLHQMQMRQQQKQDQFSEDLLDGKLGGVANSQQPIHGEHHGYFITQPEQVAVNPQQILQPISVVPEEQTRKQSQQPHQQQQQQQQQQLHQPMATIIQPTNAGDDEGDTKSGIENQEPQQHQLALVLKRSRPNGEEAYALIDLRSFLASSTYIPNPEPHLLAAAAGGKATFFNVLAASEEDEKPPIIKDEEEEKKLLTSPPPPPMPPPAIQTEPTSTTVDMIQRELAQQQPTIIQPEIQFAQQQHNNVLSQLSPQQQSTQQQQTQLQFVQNEQAMQQQQYLSPSDQQHNQHSVVIQQAPPHQQQQQQQQAIYQQPQQNELAFSQQQLMDFASVEVPIADYEHALVPIYIGPNGEAYQIPIVNNDGTTASVQFQDGEAIQILQASPSGSFIPQQQPQQPIGGGGTFEETHTGDGFVQVIAAAEPATSAPQSTNQFQPQMQQQVVTSSGSNNTQQQQQQQQQEQPVTGLVQIATAGIESVTPMEAIESVNQERETVDKSQTDMPTTSSSVSAAAAAPPPPPPTTSTAEAASKENDTAVNDDERRLPSTSAANQTAVVVPAEETVDQSSSAASAHEVGRQAIIPAGNSEESGEKQTETAQIDNNKSGHKTAEKGIDFSMF